MWRGIRVVVNSVLAGVVRSGLTWSLAWRKSLCSVGLYIVQRISVTARMSGTDKFPRWRWPCKLWVGAHWLRRQSHQVFGSFLGSDILISCPIWCWCKRRQTSAAALLLRNTFGKFLLCLEISNFATGSWECKGQTTKLFRCSYSWYLWIDDFLLPFF